MLIHNREFQIPADGWFHLAPLGKHPAFVEHGTEPVRVIQVVNTETVQGLVNRFNADKQADPTHALLWDFDHESEDNNKRTEAAGWIEELQIRNDGLWGRGRLSDLGEGAIKGGRYRKTSPVWDYEVIGGGELRNGAEVKPLRLKSLAMTNKPNLKGLKPLSNRQPASATPASNEDKPKGQQMKNIAVKLGLAPEASEEQILNAVGKIQTDIANRDTELAKLNDSVIAGEVTALGVTDEAEVKEVTAILKNSGDRAATLKVLKNRFNAASKPDASKTITNRATAKTPNGNPAGKLANREQAQTALVNTIKNSRQCSFEDAWELAKAEKPELFAENETEEQA